MCIEICKCNVLKSTVEIQDFIHSAGKRWLNKINHIEKLNEMLYQGNIRPRFYDRPFCIHCQLANLRHSLGQKILHGQIPISHIIPL